VAECTCLENRRARKGSVGSNPTPSARKYSKDMALRKLPFTLTKRQWAGVVCIYAAALGWAAELVIPFITLPYKWTVFTVVLIAAESLFLIGIFLLGKATYRQLKQWITQTLQKPPEGGLKK
jgi:hypothetical protein